jgi:hypothetical protein
MFSIMIIIIKRLCTTQISTKWTLSAKWTLGTYKNKTGKQDSLVGKALDSQDERYWV